MEVWARLGRTLDTWCWAGASRGPACPHGPLSRWTLSPPPWALRLLPLRVTFSRLLQSAPGARDTWCARDIRAPCCQLLCSFTRSFCFFLSPFLLFSFSFFFLWLPCSTWSPGPGIGSEWWFWPKLQPWPHGIPSPLWWLRIEHASHCSQDIADPIVPQRARLLFHFLLQMPRDPDGPGSASAVPGGYHLGAISLAGAEWMTWDVGAQQQGLWHDGYTHGHAMLERDSRPGVDSCSGPYRGTCLRKSEHL